MIRRGQLRLSERADEGYASAVPNLDFFAARPDLDAVLDFVFNETECQVFESYSTPGRPLVTFASTAEVLHAFDGSGGVHLGLMLYADEMKGHYRIRRFDLKRELFPDTPWRETMEGWGLIQLELNGVRNGRLEHCHTNHNSQARASKWEVTYPDFPPAHEWDFGAVARISSRINRHIRTRLAVARVGSKPLLSGAQALLATGAAKLGM